jgi:hypothetical protein
VGGPLAGHPRAQRAEIRRAMYSITREVGRRGPDMPNVKINRPLLEASKNNGGEMLEFGREQAYAIDPMPRPKYSNGLPRAPVPPGEDLIGEAVRKEPKHYQHLTRQGLPPIAPRFKLAGFQEPDEIWSWYELHKLRAAANFAVQKYHEQPVDDTGNNAQGKPCSWKGHTIRMPIGPRGVNRRAEVVGPYSMIKPQSKIVPTLIGAVFSYPGPSNPKNRGYRRWERLVVRFIKKHYGVENVVMVVRHEDERHGHVHALIARPDAKPIIAMMSTRAEVIRQRAAGVPSSKLGEAYRQGGRNFQDALYEAVGRHMGWKREGEESYNREPAWKMKMRADMAEEVSEINAQAVIVKAQASSMMEQARAMLAAAEARVIAATAAVNTMQAAAESQMQQAMLAARRRQKDEADRALAALRRKLNVELQREAEEAESARKREHAARMLEFERAQENAAHQARVDFAADLIELVRAKKRFGEITEKAAETLLLFAEDAKASGGKGRGGGKGEGLLPSRARRIQVSARAVVGPQEPPGSTGPEFD